MELRVAQVLPQTVLVDQQPFHVHLPIEDQGNAVGGHRARESPCGWQRPHLLGPAIERVVELGQRELTAHHARDEQRRGHDRCLPLPADPLEGPETRG